jgi:DNA repair protein RecO
MEGIVVGRQAYQETSLIVRWITRERGRLSTIARGALRPNSAFRGQLDLYYQCEIDVALSARGDLHSLREATMREAHLGLRRHYANILAAEYFGALIESITEADAPVRDEYDLFGKALGYLNHKAATKRVVDRFEARLFQLAGVRDLAGAVAGHHVTLPRQRARLLQELRG